MKNTAIAGAGAHIDGGQSAPALPHRVASPIEAYSAPVTDRGKFDLAFACGVSAAFWGVVIFLLTVLF